MTFTGKVLLTMRLTALILLCACLQVCAKGYAQITLSETNAPLQKVFKEIKKQTGYDFLYNSELLEKAGKITIQLKNVSLQQAVEECLKGKGLDYEIQEKTVIIKKKIVQPSASPNKLSTEKEFPPIDIHGHVTDSSGNPLVGASITVKGSRKGTTTDSKGNFVLTGVSGNSILIISYTGYGTNQYRVNGSNDIVISLIKSNSPLDEVQVIAYGTTTARFNTGDVTTISASDIEKQPVNNPLLALEGRVPGLFVTQATGYAGSGVTDLVQGQNSIVNGNIPFYVVDGVPYPQQLLPNDGLILGISGVTQIQNGNPLSFINPSDIESISVLKDADATAIYGSRAANGAIIITTKKGKAGETRVNFDLQQGFGRDARKLDLLSTSQYLQMRQEALNNDGINPSLANGDFDLLLWDTTKNTNWQKVLLGGTALYTNLNGSISGGNSNTQYLVGATFHRETTVLPINFADQKGSIHTSINSSSSNQKFHFNLSGSYLIDDNDLPQSDIAATAMLLAPDAPTLYAKGGGVNWEPYQGTSTFSVNPIASLYQTYRNKTNNLIANSVISYQIVPGLDLRSSFGYSNLLSNAIGINPFSAVPPENQPYSQRTAGYTTNDINSWIVEPQITYKITNGKNNFSILAGSTIQQNNSNGQKIAGTGYATDQALESIQNASYISVQSTTYAIYKYNALFGRINYNWDNKYLLNLTARRDGSSRFGPANQFHDFGAVGLAWIFSQESFFKKAIPFLNFGKIRASYGTTGNDQVGDYQFLNQYYPVNPQVAYQNSNTLAPGGLTNPYLQWEETRKLEIGLDLSFLQDLLILDVSYNHNRSSNQLLPYVLPITTGFSSISENLPATVQNTGIELTLKSQNIKTRDFNWTSSFNLTIPRNKLISYPDLSTSSNATNLVIGKPISIIKAYHFLGVDPATGIYAFSDGHGGITNTPDTNLAVSRYVVINTAPTFYGGFQNSIRYKDFELDILFQFTKQIGPNYYFGSLYVGTFNANQPTYVLNRWQKPGQIATHQRYSSDFSLFQPTADVSASDAAYSDASYIRLKNLSLSWHINDAWVKKAHLRSCRIYVQGQNLLTFTHYKGLDPETQSYSTLPPLQVFTMGLQMEL